MAIGNSHFQGIPLYHYTKKYMVCT